jgi:hypothetical protein
VVCVEFDDGGCNHIKEFLNADFLLKEFLLLVALPQGILPSQFGFEHKKTAMFLWRRWTHLEPSMV